jgi:hypothetical protein
MGSQFVRHAVLAGLACAPILVSAADLSVEERLKALEARQQQLEQMIRERDARIEQLERERPMTAGASAPSTASAGVAGVATAAPAGTAAPAAATGTAAAAATVATAGQADPAPSPDVESADETKYWGEYHTGRGAVLASTPYGEVAFSAFSYMRYLNQKALDDYYTDAFGRTTKLDLREDLQLQKVMLYFKGWAIEPDFRYLFYAWTANTSQGQGAQVVLGGNLSYTFDPAFSLGVGIGALPAKRSTNNIFPNLLRVDNRTIADDFFGASYTSGIWAWGELAPGLRYRVMLGNNLSQLGVDASQLDSNLNTFSGALWWMPTTGEYGPAEGWGDFEEHEEPATLFSVHYTYSREDAQNQPDVNSFENSQIRLSDGTLLFSPDPFGTGGQVNKATYRMAAASAGVKYRGWSLDGEYFWRTVDDFRTSGFVPVDELNDHGFQLQGSVMVLPRSLQAYVSGSKIYGEYGDPWDTALGLNWYPKKMKPLRINVQGLYLQDSPTGNNTVPFIVGANGWVFTTDVVLNF